MKWRLHLFSGKKSTEVSLIQDSLNIGNVPEDSNQNDEWVILLYSRGDIKETQITQEKFAEKKTIWENSVMVYRIWKARPQD